NWIPSDEIIADHRRYGAEDCAAVWNYNPNTMQTRPSSYRQKMNF
ncbi:unnamed protein product, partial [Allacma fusca]